MPAAGVGGGENPTSPPQAAPRGTTEPSVEDTGVGADHPGRLRGDPEAVLTVGADRPILVTECLLDRGRTDGAHSDVLVMSRKPADDPHAQTGQRLVVLTLPSRRRGGARTG